MRQYLDFLRHIRERGASKMSRTVIFEAFARVARWGISARLRGHWVSSKTGSHDVASLYEQFLNEPPPLGP